MSRNFSTLDEVYAVVLGVINKQEAKITRTQFNNRLDILLLDKVDKYQFKSIVDTVKGDSSLKDVFEKASYGVYSLSDLETATGVDINPDKENELLTPYVISKNVNRAQVRAFNRAQSKMVAQEYLSKEISKEISKSIGELPKLIKSMEHTSNVLPPEDQALIVTPSDWHIGARVDTADNTYNYDVALSRLQKYTDEVINKVIHYNPSEVVIVHLGDFIEGIDMRNINQAFEADMDATSQLAVAIRMYVKFIIDISVVAKKVTVGSIGGNHDRFTGNKKDAIYNDNMVYNVVDTLLMLKEYGGLPDNVYIIDNKQDIYSIELSVLDKNLLFVHGDHEDRRDVPKINHHIKDRVFDYLFMGHYHFVKNLQEEYSRMSFMVGSLMGANNYAKQIGAPTSQASQQITLISRKDNNPIIMPIYL